MDLIGILDPYLVLVLLGDNPANLDVGISWNFGPLVSAGWARREDFRAGARRRQTFLIATEGTSDIGILKRGLDPICPDITDFFRFVDAAESHPFAGAGRMVNFAQGCVRIDVQNQILFLLDNGAEGVDAKRRIERLAMLGNMAVLTLPDLADLSAMTAIGPDGPAVADITAAPRPSNATSISAVRDCPSPWSDGRLSRTRSTPTKVRCNGRRPTVAPSSAMALCLTMTCPSSMHS